MRELALFTGAGGGILGGKLLGWRTVCAVEIDNYCRHVLIQRQNDGILEPFPIWDDVRTFDGKSWRGIVDVVSGGFPCQRFSSAARGRNNAEDLWPEMQRIIGEAKPPFVFAENVSRAAIEIAAEDIEQMGYAAKLLPLSAKDLGADHERRRYWLFGNADMHSKSGRQVNDEMAELPSTGPRIWEDYTNESGVANGLAFRVDKLRAIGNGQVPAVAALAWRLLSGEH